jgi:MFS family permease
MRNLLHRAIGRTVGLNSWYLCVEIFWATIYASAQTFNGAFAIRLGATNAEVSLLTSVPALTAVLISLPAGRFLQTRSEPRRWMLGSLLVARTGALLVVLVPWLHLGEWSQGAVLVALLIAWTIPLHFFNLAFIPFLSHAVAERNRATVFAARNALMGAVLAVFSFLFGVWLNRVAFPFNYQAMYLAGFVFALLSTYYLSKVEAREPAPIQVPGVRLPLRQALRHQITSIRAAMTEVPGFTQITINTFLHGVGVWGAAPLYLLYFVKDLGASEAWLGVFGAAGSLATIVGYLFWQRFILRRGEPLTLKLTIVSIGLYPLLAGLIPSLNVILLAAALNGFLVGGVGLSHFNTLLKLMPDGKKHEYLALYTVLLNVGAFICPLVAVALANRFGFAPVLIACGLSSIIGSTSFWFWPVVTAPAQERDLVPNSG